MRRMQETICTPSVAIAMPFFNSAATLELSIRSLLNQSYGDFGCRRRRLSRIGCSYSWLFLRIIKR